MRSTLPLLMLVCFVMGCGANEYKAAKSASLSYKSDNPVGVNAVTSPDPSATRSDGEVKKNSESKALSASASADSKDVVRKIVYNATVTLVVEQFDPVPEQVNSLAKRFGAYVARSQISGSAGSPRSGHWTLRVPAERFEEFLVSARQVGEVQNVGLDSQDVTDEYYDIDARVRNKKQEETRLITLMAKEAGRLEEILNLERELTRVRGDVEQLEGRLHVLGSLAAMGTVVLDVNEIKNYLPEKEITYNTRVRQAWDESTRTLTSAAQAVSIFFVAAAPWLIIVIPLFAVIGIAWRRLRWKFT